MCLIARHTFSLGPATRFLSHTRFLFTLRSLSRSSQYHSLLLFRLRSLSFGSSLLDVPSPRVLDTTSPSCEDFSKALNDVNAPKSGENKDVIHALGQLYVMESTCPHLGAELSHAEIEECGHDSVVAGS
jgi:hypothetical protein